MGRRAIDPLMHVAVAVRERALALSFDFKVGAAIGSETGAVHVGSNIESAGRPKSQRAVASPVGVALTARGGRFTRPPALPGAQAWGCRQHVREFASLPRPSAAGAQRGAGRRSSPPD